MAEIVDNKAFSGITFDTAEDLEARLRLLDAERARLLSAIKAYRAVPVDEDLKGLSLDGLTVKDAIVELLKFTAARGKEELSAGEIESTLANFKIRTSRGGRQAGQTRGVWWLLVKVLTAPANAGLITIKRTGKGVSRADRISLAKSP